MRCLLIERFGEPTEVLTVAERPLPEPGPGQVRIKLLESPIHNHDLAILRGVYGVKPSLPAIPGTEAVGLVDALGPDAGGLALGQRVAVGGVNGTWAEHFLVPARAAVPVPADLPDGVACQLLAMPVSAYMLIEDLQVTRGDWIIQNAAGGAVGRLMNVLADDRGINVINLVRRSSAVASLEAAGVRHVLATDDPAWADQIPRLTGGAPVVRAVDSVGGKAASALLGVLGFEGILISFGGLSGEPLVIDVRPLLFKQTVVKGFWATRRGESTPAADYRRMVGEILGLAAQGRLPLTVSATFDLAQAREAAAAAERPGRSGKVTLRG
jgi:NADPH:quinone reductase